MNFETAQNLDEAFVNATEVNLATLEDLLMLRKTSKSRVQRQRSICFSMLKICASKLLASSQVRWTYNGSQREFPRVSDMLANSDPAAIERALELHILKVQGLGHAKQPELHPE